MGSINSFRSSVRWLFIGNTGGQVLGFLFGIILTRLLAPEHFGVLLTTQVFTGFAGLLAGGGMGQALIRAKTASSEDYASVFTLQLIIGIAIYFIFFFLAPVFSSWYRNSIYTDLLRVSALSFILRPFVNLPTTLLHREMRFNTIAIYNVGILVLTSTISILLATMGMEVWALVIGGLLGSIASIFILFFITTWRPTLTTNLIQAKHLARYGAMTSATDIIFYLRQQMSTAILSSTLGASAVGLYNKGESLARMPHGFASGSVYHVLFRAIAADQDNLDRCRYLFFRSITLLAIYLTPVYIILFWVADPLILFIYGEKWQSSASVIAIICFAWPALLLDNMSGAVLAAHNWLRFELPVQFGALVLSVPAIYLGQNFGIEGVAVAIVAVFFVSGTVMSILAGRCLGARTRDFIAALQPALILNALLIFATLLLNYFFAEPNGTISFLNMIFFGVIAALFYLFCFISIPLERIASEQDRYKNLITKVILGR